MKNRLHRSLQGILLLFLIAGVSGPLYAQFDFNYPGPTVFYLDDNCEDILDFNGMPPFVTSTIGANIITPPTGVDAALTGYAVNDVVSGSQIVNVAFIAADDQSNQDTFFFALSFLDTIAPFFADPNPPDLELDCAGDFPPTQVRTAMDNCSAFPILVNSVDIPMPPTSSCSTPDTIYRVWTVIDGSANLAVDTQRIIIGVDTSPPTIGVEASDGFFDCENPGYNFWINTQEITLLASGTDNCNVLTVSNDGPATFDDPCGSVTVTFTLTDGCGLTATSEATYTVVDTVFPVLIGVPNDTMIACSEAIPSASSVTATDNCDPSLMPVVLVENTTQTNDGSCTDFTYTITRTWSVTDFCGNTTEATQTIDIFDDVVPTFDIPQDTTVHCDVSTDPASTGNVSNVMDNCGSPVDITFVDSFDTLTCPQNVKINRVWIATDACGNADSDIQEIFLIDTLPPTFTPPADTVYLDCENVGDIGITGMPTDVADQCDGGPTFSNVDETFDILCTHSYSIRRKWFVEDACGNVDSSMQILIVRDTTPPEIVTAAADLVIACTNDADAELAFNTWVAGFGFAVANDICSGSNVTWTAFNAGTMDAPSLPPPNCPSPVMGVYRTQDIDFVVTDECGNSQITTANFSVMDNTPPVIVECPTDTVIGTDPGICEANFTLIPPVVTEECGEADLMLDYSETLPITSPGPFGDLEIIVNDLNFVFLVAPSPTVATGDVTLTIDLNNMDAEELTEYFNVFGEDGSNLGQTNNTPDQCEDSSTSFTIPAATYNMWAEDGIVNITLVANIPSGLPGRFSVNNICSNADVTASLSYPASVPTGIRLEYSLNNGPRMDVAPIAPINEVFPLGTTLVTYFVSDCAGNEVSCSFNVTVEDQEPPVLTCPADTTINVDPGTCEGTLQIPTPVNVTDNCGATTEYTQTQPFFANDALITFTINPNLGEYQADDKVFVFSGVNSNAVGPVTLSFEIMADVDSLGEYFTILDQNNMPIGNTEIGQPHVIPGDCNTPSIATFTLDAAYFNSLAFGGFVVFVAESFIDFLPGSGSGLGINPCDPGPVTANGLPDGISTIFATLEFESISSTYFAEGATTIPPTPLGAIPPTHVFNEGVTTVSYFVEDFAGNLDTCSFNVTVLDNEAPTAICEPATNVFVNPSGLDQLIIPPTEIDLGSTDNCGIDSMWVDAPIITCDMIEDTMTVYLNVIDASGNVDICPSLVKVRGEAPEVSYSTGLCGSDTLYLMGTPPSPGSFWIYSWEGPPPFSSMVQNPIIPNATSDDAGVYTLTIEGITGCTSSAEITVAIEDLPLTPILTVEENEICFDDPIILETDPIPGGGNIQYFWYNGTAPTGTLVGVTLTSSLTIPGPHMAGDSCYYVIAERDGCSSDPSASKCVQITGQPVAETWDEVIDICEGDAFQLGTDAGPGLTYEWTGPNYFSTLQIPAPVTNVTLFNDGVYSLVVYENGCPSEPDFTVVNVLEKPDTPELDNNSSIVNPVCLGDTIILTASIPGAITYEWYSPTFEVFVTNTNTLIIEEAELDDDGAWKVLIKDGFCESDTSLASIVYVEDLPNISPMSNSPVCTNEMLELTANDIAGAIYTWEDPSSNTYNGKDQTLPPIPGTYSVTITSAGGCKNSASLEVEVNEAPQITAISSNEPDCPEGPIDVSLFPTTFPAGSYTYEWTGGPTGGYFSDDPVAIVPGATSADNGTYILVITDVNNCSSEPEPYELNIAEFLPAPAIPTLSEPGPFCVGDTVTISTVDVYDGDVEIFHWHTPGLGVIQTNVPSLELNGLTLDDDGSYLVIVEVDGCVTDSSGTLPIQVNPIPEVNPTSNSPVCEGDEIQLFIDCFPSGNPVYAWTGPVTSALCNPVIPNATEDLEGTYFITVTVNGCVSETQSTFVQVDPKPATPILESTGSVCLDDPDAELILTIVGGTTPGADYIWYNDALPEPIDTTSNILLVISDFSGFPPGPNTFYVEAVKDDCRSENSLPVEVNFDEIPMNTANAGVDINACEGLPVNLEGTQPTVGTGLWTLIDGPGGLNIANPDDATTSLTGLIPGETYILNGLYPMVLV